jgi:hypothetical protein
MGISGVVLGTVISSLVIWIAEVVYTYRIVINNSLIHYFLRQGLYVVQLLIIYAIVYEINTLFYTDNVLTTLIIKGILIPIMTIIFLVGFNIKNPYVRSFYNRVEVIIKK